MNTSLRWCAMVSGSCTLLESMCAEGLLPSLVVSDRNKDCRAEEITSAYKLPHLLLPRQDFRDNGVFDRETYTKVLTDLLHHYEIDFITMVGFMTVLSPSIFERFAGRITNNHPALLPDFKGEHAVRDALKAGVAETGCTIHVATARLDDGPIIAQQRVPVLSDDTEQTLHERIKQAERPLIASVVREILLGERSLPGFALVS